MKIIKKLSLKILIFLFLFGNAKAMEETLQGFNSYMTEETGSIFGNFRFSDSNIVSEDTYERDSLIESVPERISSAQNVLEVIQYTENGKILSVIKDDIDYKKYDEPYEYQAGIDDEHKAEKECKIKLDENSKQSQNTVSDASSIWKGSSESIAKKEYFTLLPSEITYIILQYFALNYDGLHILEKLKMLSLVSKYFKIHIDKFKTSKMVKYVVRSLQSDAIKYLKQVQHAEKIISELSTVAKEGDLERIKFLILGGANLVQNKVGNTALILACKNGYKEIAEVLIRIGAQLNTLSNSNIIRQSPKTYHQGWIYSKRWAEWDQEKDERKSHAYLNIQNDQRYTALMRAVKKGYTEIAKMLIKAGADLNIRDKYGRTALSLAVVKENNEIAEILIISGANLNSEGMFGNTVLMLAAKLGKQEIGEMLINGGADLDIQDKDKMTALMFAVKKGHPGIVKSLIIKGGDLNKQDAKGNTALIYAAIVGNKEIVEMLIVLADLNIKDKDGKTAAELAESSGHHDIAKLLNDRNYKRKY